MNIKEDYNLRENADIVAMAMKSAKTLDSTELKEWFDKKYDRPCKLSLLWGFGIGLFTALLIFTFTTKDTPKDYYDTDITKTTIKAHK